MSDSQSLPNKLPPTEKEISLEVIGAVTKREYKGQFLYQIPNGKMRGKAAIKKAELNAGLRDDQLDSDVANFHFIISYLFATIKDAPKWWRDDENGYALYDLNVAEALFSKCIEFEQNWLKEVWGEVPDESAKSQE